MQDLPLALVHWVKVVTHAVKCGDSTLIDYLLEHADAEATQAYIHTSQFLITLCRGAESERTLVQVLRSVSAKGWPLSGVDAQGWTLLHCAARLGSKRAVRLLAARPDIDLNAQKADGFSALHVAIVNDRTDVVDELFEAARARNVELATGAFVSDGRHALHLARTARTLARLLSRASFRALVNVPVAVRVPLCGPISAHDYPLHAALGSDDVVASVLLLLTAGADIAARGAAQHSVITSAIVRGGSWTGALVDAVLRHAERVDGTEARIMLASAPCGSMCMTPLHMASMNRNKRVVRALVRAGAPLDALDAEGHSALWHALSVGAAKIAALLRAAGAAEPAVAPPTRAPCVGCGSTTRCIHHLMNSGGGRDGATSGADMLYMMFGLFGGR